MHGNINDVVVHVYLCVWLRWIMIAETSHSKLEMLWNVKKMILSIEKWQEEVTILTLFYKLRAIV